jgi:hypothetical protein
MRVCMSYSSDYGRRNGQEWNIINLKMFQNGKIQMTGCQSFEQARECVQFLIDKLMAKAPVMRVKRDCMTAIRCHSANNSFTKTLIKSGADSAVNGGLDTLHKDLLTKIMLHVNNETLFACREVCRYFQNILEDEQFWILKCERELRCRVSQT